jgi:aryl-alcohol dehydrogenase-like predicted oxidoreductase
MRTLPRATAAGTRAYVRRFNGRAANGHFRHALGLTLSSIGLGTYLGSQDAKGDCAYRDAVVACVQSGVNVIDSAVSYRLQRSERAVGRALTDLVREGFAREGLIIATKGGYIPSRDPERYFDEEIVRHGLAASHDLTAGCHCLAPGYLRHQLHTSLENLGLETVDIYYLHNPEHQLDEVSSRVFVKRMRSAFELLEQMAADDRIGVYGTATWNGYRMTSRRRGTLSLELLVNLAREVAGDAHHFKVIQLPFNLAMPEARLAATQYVAGRRVNALEAARALGITVITSAPLLQGRLAHGLPNELRHTLPDLDTDAQRAIQFARSVRDVTTTLVGMRHVNHIRQNLALVGVPPAPARAIENLLAQA